MEYNFELKAVTIRRWVKEGILKARTISYYGKGTHAQLFLIEDNKDFLPPKDLLKSHSVKTREKDGKDYTHMEKWYRFVDPFEHLKGYKIMNYMRVVTPEEMKARKEAEEKKAEERRIRREERKKNKDRRKIE